MVHDRLAFVLQSGDPVELARNVATGEGLAPLLLVIGFVLIVFSMAVFGYLTLGAFGSLLTPE